MVAIHGGTHQYASLRSATLERDTVIRIPHGGENYAASSLLQGGVTPLVFGGHGVF
ncbi:MAG: hypothetical protein KZQ90_11615 [Candidatus Thiodiazotropha sp. (ex Codakia rugifera)]|nr:hypothetical protein [Candidatus Thiodiazotropha sp. (ex Codakia rugifera)]